jgi:hypothetical protein
MSYEVIEPSRNKAMRYIVLTIIAISAILIILISITIANSNTIDEGGG